MLLKKWNDLPSSMKNEDIKKYYHVLKNKTYSLVLKRTFDVILSMVLIVLLSPIMVFLAVWIKIDSRGPVFYRQERVTQYGKIFRIFKFRTMVVEADKVGSLVTKQNDDRITKVGNKIRKCRLDELPQLINIFKGDMSFVGTRPEVEKYVNAYTNEMKATLLLPAGVTSLASILFKSEDEIIEEELLKDKNIDEVYIEKILPKKMILNLDYIKNYSFYIDIKICIKTFKEVLF